MSVFRLTPLTPPPLRCKQGECASLLSIDASRRGDRYVISPKGDVDASTSARLGASIQEAEATDAKRIVVDLTGVTFMDSSGLHLLLDAQQRAARDSGRLRLIRGPRRVNRVFELTDTEDVLPFLD